MAFDFSTFHDQAKKSLTHLIMELGQLRTGRASAQLLDPVSVEAYGAKMKVAELATVTVPDPTLIVITPWDKSLLSAIEKGINIASLNLNPVVDGQVIRIAIPPLTEERRKEMVKVLQQKLESGRVMLRSIRTDTKKEIDNQKGQPGISEDAIVADLEQLEAHLKTYMAQLDDVGKRKEQELMTI